MRENFSVSRTGYKNHDRALRYFPKGVISNYSVDWYSEDLYAMKGEVLDVPRLQRTLVHLKRPRG